MRNKNNKHLGLEIDPTLHYKLKYIAQYEGRSANGQICASAFGNLRPEKASFPPPSMNKKTDGAPHRQSFVIFHHPTNSSKASSAWACSSARPPITGRPRLRASASSAVSRG